MEGRMPSTRASLFNAPLTDGELMLLAHHGDRAAYGQVVLLFQDRIYNGLLRLVADPAEAAALTQETFMRGLSKIAEYPATAEPYAWLFGIAMNLGLGALRKARRRCPEAVDGLEAALERLDPEYRAVLVMRDIESFDYQRMSDVLSLSPPAVKSRLFRARLALRDELATNLKD
jgi:RNA polymerase sigma-70 factor, ECF subfamily